MNEKGRVLERGEATRQAVLAALPASTRDIKHATGLEYNAVRHAARTLQRLGTIECITDEHGGLVWSRVKPAPTQAPSNPWFNAWKAMETTS